MGKDGGCSIARKGEATVYSRTKAESRKQKAEKRLTVVYEGDGLQKEVRALRSTG